MEGIVASVWIYNIIAGIMFIWLSEHFYIEKKETGETYSMNESRRCMLIGAIIAIDWIVAIPILIMPKIKGDGGE